MIDIEQMVNNCDALLFSGQAIVMDRLRSLDLAVIEESGLPAAYLRKRMEELGLTVPHLAADGLYPRQYYHQILNGKKTLSNAMVRAIAANTDMTEAELHFVRALQDMGKED